MVAVAVKGTSVTGPLPDTIPETSMEKERKPVVGVVVVVAFRPKF